MIPVRNAAIVSQGVERIPGAFADYPNHVGFVTSILQGLQTLEDSAFDLLAAYSLNTTNTSMMDIFGALLNEPRGGRTNAEYAIALRVRVAVNRAQGRAEDIIKILLLLSPSAIYEEFYPGSFLVTLLGIDPRVIAPLINEARSVGTRAYLISSSDLMTAHSLVLDDATTHITGAMLGDAMDGMPSGGAGGFGFGGGFGGTFGSGFSGGGSGGTVSSIVVNFPTVTVIG